MAKLLELVEKYDKYRADIRELKSEVEKASSEMVKEVLEKELKQKKRDFDKYLDTKFYDEDYVKQIERNANVKWGR